MAIDLFPSLVEIGKKRNILWYDSLSDEDKKSAHPFVLARWLTGTSDKQQILQYNMRVNPFLFSLGNEKPLLFKLMATSATGVNGRYQWIKAPGSNKTPQIQQLKVIAEYYNLSKREAGLYLPQISDEDKLVMAEELGWSKEDIALLKKEFGSGSRVAKTKNSKSKK